MSLIYIFIHSVMAYMHQRLPLCQDAPVSTLPDPFEHPQWYGEIWFKFPSAPTMFSTHLSQFTKAKIELWCIARDMASQIEELKVRHAGLLANQVLTFCSRLGHWYRNLPRCMRPDRIVTPYQLQLQSVFMELTSICVSCRETKYFAACNSIIT